MDDFCYAGELSALLDSMDRTDELPKTILYCLNQRDYEMLASMCGNFQSAPHRGKIQFGTAWWFCDNKRGMEAQLDVLANLSLLPVSIGMLTDSRSFLSCPRHEYYRRILCNKIGSWVEDGEYPCHMEFLGTYVSIDPAEKLSLVYMHNLFPNREAYIHPRIRNIVYGVL